jgi:hypothetical protein
MVYVMACTVAGPRVPGYIPMGLHEIIRIQESPTTIQELKSDTMDQISTVIQELLCPMFDSL